MGESYYVYILAGKRNETLYTGVTNDLVRRVSEHKDGLIEGFTKKYNVHMIVYFEQLDSVEDSITREQRIKSWKRKWKLELVEKKNPGWKDLYYDLV